MRKKHQVKSMICPKCHSEFILGESGIFTKDQFLCDSCAGVERDSMGYAWLPGESDKIVFSYRGRAIVLHHPILDRSRIYHVEFIEEDDTKRIC